MSSRYEGRWVQLRSRPDLGFGFCTGGFGTDVHVKYVDIPGVAEHSVSAPERDVVDATLPIGTRVWVEGTPHGWHPGVIRSTTSGHRLHIDLVGASQNFVLTHRQFVIRWAQPLQDPALAVAHGLIESPDYYDARSGLLGEFIKQRRVGRGITAPFSAPIELFHHQIDTAARVLADPVMRYLLADEVGLGKTIEAGLVARQLLIEDSTARVLVLCPESLVGQWRSELRDRLALGDQLRTGAIVVGEHESVALVGTQIAKYDLVIIDEAHKILPYGRPGSNVEWDLRNVDGLLALSATPMRGDLTTLRRLLALVDPLAFGNIDQTAFLERLQEREKTAADIQVLSARRASLRQKLSALESIVSDFEGDSRVNELASDCRISGDPGDESWSALADYLREVHRLSRRMIRHRRDGEFMSDYTVPGRFPTFLDVEDPARELVDAFLEDFRRSVASPGADAGFAQVVECALAGPRPLREALATSLRADESAVGGLGMLRPLFEATIARLDMSGLDYRLQAVQAIVRDRVDQGLKVVVVSSFASTAQQFENLVRGSVGMYSVFTHYASTATAVRDSAVAAFVSRYGGAVLVADQSMEEGRNLQAAEVLVNLDLPLDANRLDQRIGRLDRYSERRTAAEIVVLREATSDWTSAHLDLLDQGIGVLVTSVSTVQRLLASTLQQVVSSLIPDGADAMRFDNLTLRHTLDQERDAIDLLEELESVTAAAVFSDQAFAELVESDSDSQHLRSALRRFTHGVGSLPLGTKESKDGVLSFEAATNRMGLPADEAARVKSLLLPKALDRAVAIHVPDVAPFRIGDPFVDWLEEHLLMDERGRASSVVRPVSGIYAPMMWLHSDFIIEFDGKSHASELLGARRLQRRGEAHLPPIRIGLWTDPFGAAPDSVLEYLQTPHAELRDEILRGRVWKPVLEAFPSWERLCRDSAAYAREIMLKSAELQEAITKALDAASSDVRRRTSILEARSRRLSSVWERRAALEELELERAVGDALHQGITTPLVRNVAAAACVLWPEGNF